MIGPVLFLDLATVTGWCEGVPGEKPISGSLRLSYQGATPAEKYAALFEFLGQRTAVTRYHTIAFEAPLDPRHMGSKTNMNTARVLMGLAAITEAICGLTGTRTYECHLSDVRKFILAGSKPAKDEMKVAVIKMVRLMGHEPKDDNEADAVAGWYYATAILDPRNAHNTQPLFRK